MRVDGVQIPAGVQENEAQHGTACPTESTTPQPESSSLASLFWVCFCSSFYDDSTSLVSDNNLRELEQTGWPVLAGHRSGCLLRFWLWLSWREWGSGSGWHSATPRTNKQEHLGKRHDKNRGQTAGVKRPQSCQAFPAWWISDRATRAPALFFFSLFDRRCLFFWVNKKGADPLSLAPHSPWKIRKQDESIIGTGRQLEGGNGERELKKDDEKFSRTLLSHEGVGVWTTVLMRLPKSKMVSFSCWAISEYHWGFYSFFFPVSSTHSLILIY